MLLAMLLAVQAAQAAQAGQAAPDIDLEIRATVRDVRIERSGETSLEVHGEPDGGSHVDVDRPRSGGRRHLRNVTVRVKAEGRIADPGQNPAPAETPSPQ